LPFCAVIYNIIRDIRLPVDMLAAVVWYARTGPASTLIGARPACRPT
jgi:hypothetical protein